MTGALLTAATLPVYAASFTGLGLCLAVYAAAYTVALLRRAILPR